MNIQNDIEQKIISHFKPAHLELENESHRHGGGALDSHFKLTVVSESFASKSLVRRHQEIYQLLSDELAGPVHALALHLYTPSEWLHRSNEAPLSPDCKGGGG